jgi:hypothetical protein
LQLVDHLLPFGWNHELRLQARRAEKDGLLRRDREPQQILDPAVLHVHVHFNLPAADPLQPDDRAVCGHRRVEKRRLHLVQVRITIRTIDDGGETRF